MFNEIVILEIAKKFWVYVPLRQVRVPLANTGKRFYKVFDTEQQAVDYIYNG